MRKLIRKAVMPMVCLFTTTTLLAQTSHTTDGNISEWNTGKFETDNATKISYSFDNDAQNLYVAMKVADPDMQKKIAMRGMVLFIDKKAKKKERVGVEFPMRKEGGAPGQPDPAKMAANMIVMKTFGFEDQEDKTMFLGQSEGVNVSFQWDASNILYLEYKIPMAYIGDNASLKDKPMTIGWKIAPPVIATALETNDRVGGTGNGGKASLSGGRGSRNSGVGGSGDAASGLSPAADKVKEDNVWSTYVITLK